MIGAIEPRRDGRRLALALAGRFFRPRGALSGRRDRILVVRPDHLGDLLFLTPALARLRRGLPDAEIVGLVGSWGVPALENNPAIDRLIVWNFPWFDRKPRRSLLGPYWSLLQLARVLRAERFDLALQFRPDFWWGALAVRLAGVPDHVGFAVPTVRPFLTRALPIVHGRHAVEENLALAEAVAGPDGPGSPCRLVFPVSEPDRRRARELVGPNGDARPLVAIQVGAGAAVKLWPVERLAEVGRVLRDRHAARLVAIGGAIERDAVDLVVSLIGDDAIGLAGATTLGELAAVLEGCALAFGPDSGPLHLAVAVGTPTVHLFGPADPRRFGPYGDPARHRVVRSRWPCCPCDQLAFAGSELSLHRCMAEISAAEVIDVAGALLDMSSELRR